MKFVSVRDFRTHPKEIWDNLKEMPEIIITNNGKPIAILHSVDDKNIEDTLKVLRAEKAKQEVEKMRRISLKKGNDKLNDKDIDKIIKNIRNRK